MKRIMTIYVVLFSFLISQDVFQLFVKKTAEVFEKNNISRILDLDTNSEDLEDPSEDESELTIEDFCSISQDLQILYTRYQSKLNIFQQDVHWGNIYLEKSTPPPQV